MASTKSMGAAAAVKRKSEKRKAKSGKQTVSAFPLSDFRFSVCVLGLWHLGCVTATCCAKHFEVIGLDFDEANVARLSQGQAPLFEPGLNELIAVGLAARKLSFTSDPKIACANTDVLWLAYDTPVNENDESDVDFVLSNLRRALPHLPKEALVLISSQLPVGTCKQLEAEFPHFHFACSPENLRLGRAIDAFEKADRVVVGIRDESMKPLLNELFAPFTSQILFMRTESAELVKHALNSFLALSITFINEIARLGEHVGADAKEVSAGLKSESRIGPKAYLGPGGPFAGGTLARDVVTLTRLAEANDEKIAVISAIKQSNDLHRGWVFRRLQSRLGRLRGKQIAVLGLTYTPNTDTLRRSAAVELCKQLLKAGAKVTAFDPAVKPGSAGFQPASRKSVFKRAGKMPALPELATDIAAALKAADAAVICTEWPQFRQADWAQIVPQMRGKIFVDANRFLEKELKSIADVQHLSVGRSAGGAPASFASVNTRTSRPRSISP